jgi:hypothetical protein
VDDQRGISPIDFVLAEMELGAKLLALAKVDGSGAADHLQHARWACAEARRHLSLIVLDVRDGQNYKSRYEWLACGIESLHTEIELWGGNPANPN